MILLHSESLKVVSKQCFCTSNCLSKTTDFWPTVGFMYAYQNTLLFIPWREFWLSQKRLYAPLREFWPFQKRSLTPQRQIWLSRKRLVAHQSNSWLTLKRLFCCLKEEWLLMRFWGCYTWSHFDGVIIKQATKRTQLPRSTMSQTSQELWEHVANQIFLFWLHVTVIPSKEAPLGGS